MTEPTRKKIADLLPSDPGPVAWQWLDSAHFRKKIPRGSVASEWRPLYVHPRLTLAEDEIVELWSEAVKSGQPDVMTFARAIERKVRG